MQCYLQEDDPPEQHDLERFSCVCGLCYEALSNVADSNRHALVEALLIAKQDIAEWLQLAEKQREELPNVDHLPCGPTTHAIESSRAVLIVIDDAIRKTRSR